MCEYYEHYGVNWERFNIEKQISNLQNWDILEYGQVIGALRLEFDSEGCYLRDLQVIKSHQNKGVGAAVILESEKLALQSGTNNLRLRVFKISPALKLYERAGYVINKDEDIFYYMSKVII